MSKVMKAQRYLPHSRVIQFESQPLEERRLMGAYMSAFWSSWGDGLTFDQSIDEAEGLSYDEIVLKGNQKWDQTS